MAANILQLFLVFYYPRQDQEMFSSAISVADDMSDRASLVLSLSSDIARHLQTDTGCLGLCVPEAAAAAAALGYCWASVRPILRAIYGTRRIGREPSLSALSCRHGSIGR